MLWCIHIDILTIFFSKKVEMWPIDRFLVVKLTFSKKRLRQLIFYQWIMSINN